MGLSCHNLSRPLSFSRAGPSAPPHSPPLFHSNASRFAACLAISQIKRANIANHFLFTANERFKLFFVNSFLYERVQRMGLNWGNQKPSSWPIWFFKNQKNRSIPWGVTNLVDLRVFQGGFVDNFWYACGLVPPPSTVQIWSENLKYFGCGEFYKIFRYKFASGRRRAAFNRRARHSNNKNDNYKPSKVVDGDDLAFFVLVARVDNSLFYWVGEKREREAPIDQWVEENSCTRRCDPTGKGHWVGFL